MDRFSFLNTVHAGFIGDLYEQYLTNPDAIEPSWRSLFQGYDLANEGYNIKEDEITIPVHVQKEFQVIELINGYRTRGHLFTKTNPVRERRQYNPSLDYSNFGLAASDLSAVFNAGDILGLGAVTLQEIIKHLENIYCDSIGVEYMYIREPEVIKWMQDKLNKNDNHPNYNAEAKKYIYSKLNQAVGFENFLQTKYVGQKRFSLEGGEALIPAISVLLRNASKDYDVQELVLGMAHRGRLNTLTNIFRKPVRELFSEFEGKDFEDENIDGDVKYHLGYTLSKTFKDGKSIKMNLVPNPSHLETVGPVATGIARSKADKFYNGDTSKIIPILVHGDAAIAGQGIGYELLQMSQLNGYSVGGTIHIVVNNQVGFTTNYLDARSSTYCTDLAKVTLSPVLHVNADDAEAVVHATEMALEFRMRFKKDVFIDLLGYRKYGHNEGDEPRFTQPKLYKAIAKHANPKEIYAKKLIAEEIIDADYISSETKAFKDMLEIGFNEAKQDKKSKIRSFMKDTWKDYKRESLPAMLEATDTTYSEEKLKNIAKIVSTTPENVKFLRKAERILQGRMKMVEENKIDWGMAETLAYGSLLEEGFDVRISGQDVERGTFSHRHAILKDENSEEKINLLNTNKDNKGKMSIYNSSLSEYAVLGFDYGHAMANPNSLTIWEAQFGDFSNGAQIIFDQYMSAAEDKWKLQNGIVILLPHGYEGQGSEHSSGRMERFLQLCAEDNMTVANCTTPSNFYHLLRRQMKRNYRKPLVVFTPKSLLRHPKAVSSITEFAEKGFQEIIDDSLAKVKDIKKVVFCTGKLYYELLEEREKLERNDIAIVRLEQIFPLHVEQASAIVSKYTNAETFVWAQEEPRNMGAWSHIRERMEDIVNLKLASRPYYAVPAAGSGARFRERQKRVIDAVFSI
ncbi:MAG: 2-oxoglutarate dehydrogenase E1 component [Flavobacteriaceae bacterium]|nr:2-oxoglutarate dehydrogenase E1 component [Flavobacteriaceae bacterium]